MTSYVTVPAALLLPVDELFPPARRRDVESLRRQRVEVRRAEVRDALERYRDARDTIARAEALADFRAAMERLRDVSPDAARSLTGGLR